MSLSQSFWVSCFTLLSINVLRALANVECEELPIEDCAFAVSSTGARCVLEKYAIRDGDFIYDCQTSVIMAERNIEWIETDECINACGLERMAVGLSTDGLLDPKFAARFCEPACQNSCPNIIDLFTKLAAGEGIYLPNLCNFLRPATRNLIAGDGFMHKYARFLDEYSPAPSSL
ncbi:hypothetical protein O6H91_09G092400 [Diphasiastrum complanatum]|uniref:Uncharacterized protein n=2 Tax=Diphasiastrum complanatum TaxID=34168 RepID=A0ACC2CRS9_DIPCM|nr:hypothetical protein O6H91_Y433200 [Diphasiastrum complanatum]KAJ7544765.1 hypothetical protein O6H91_09G092400 [Diphasiastrum complanatum]KAJ7544766.1 hypothetical protein O6H91_09G092400 [Diphasiastrum complanatum]